MMCSHQRAYWECKKILVHDSFKGHPRNVFILLHKLRYYVSYRWVMCSRLFLLICLLAECLGLCPHHHPQLNSQRSTNQWSFKLEICFRYVNCQNVFFLNTIWIKSCRNNISGVLSLPSAVRCLGNCHHILWYFILKKNFLCQIFFSLIQFSFSYAV